MKTNLSAFMPAFLLVFFSGSVYASQGTLWHNVEISGAGGANWINSDDTHLDVTAYERDSLHVSSTTVDGAWKAGIGYYLFRNHLLMELNVYGVSNTVKGDVWQFENPQFNNYTFEAPISSTRLMWDVKPNLITWNKLTPYLILGIGATWNTVSYQEQADAGISASSAQNLGDNTQVQLAWDVGAGLSYALTDHLNVTAEYVYAFLGEATPETGATLLSAPNFNYQIQSLLFGLSLRM
jgi:opacity protein-like surface antigen